MIFGFLISNFYFSEILFSTAPTGMLYGPIFCIGILIALSFYKPWEGVTNTLKESLFRYLVGFPVILTPFYVF